MDKNNSADVTLHVSPLGDDSSSGTEGNPLLSLEGARRLIRERHNDVRRVRVIFSKGNYPITRTVVFSVEDGRSGDGWISYEAEEFGSVTFSSGVGDLKWRKYSECNESAMVSASKHLYVAELPEGIDDCNQLYYGELPLPRSRGEGFFPENDAPEELVWHGEIQNTIKCPPSVLSSVIRPESAELHIIPVAPWSLDVVPIKSVSNCRSEIVLSRDVTYFPARPLMGCFPHGSAWIENDVGLITKPGEWAIDHEANKIYLWPPKGCDLSEIRVPSLVEFIRVEGLIKHDMPEDDVTENILFKGFNFVCSDRCTITAGREGLGLQHDWEQYDFSSAVIRFRGASSCLLERCDFNNIAGTAIRLDLTACNNVIKSNRIHGIGAVGILVAGYGPGTKNTSKGNEIVDNFITKVGQIFWDSPAIFVWQSEGNLVLRNRIKDTPYSGIVVSGRIQWDQSGRGECSRTIRWDEINPTIKQEILHDGDGAGVEWCQREPYLHARSNTVAENEISGTVQKISDGNAIYISGAGAGNVVRKNYLHDNDSCNIAEVIRCDDDQNDVTIDRNCIIWFGGYSTAIASKGINHITNNFIAYPINVTERGLISLELGPIDGSRITGNVVISSHAKDRAIFEGRLYGEGPIPNLADCLADRNFYWNTEDPEWGNSHISKCRAKGSESNSLSFDPGLSADVSEFLVLEGYEELLNAGFYLPEQVSQSRTAGV